MLRRACLLSALVALAAAAPAAATNYCVPSGAAGCTAEAGVQVALTAALNNPGADTVTIAAGTYQPASCPSGGFTYSGNSGNAVTITGAGSGQTILTCPANYNNGGSYIRVLSLAGPGTTLSGVGIHLPAGHYDRGLELDNGAAADHIAVTSDPAADDSVIGVITEDGTLTNSSVTDPVTDNGEAVDASNGSTIDRDTLASGGTTVVISGTPVSIVSRSAITALRNGVKLAGNGQGAVYDSAITVTGQGSGVGLSANVGSLAGNSLTARNVSITSTGSDAVGVGAAASGSGVTLSVSVTDSVIWGPAAAFSRTATSTGSANLTATYDDYPAGSYAGTGSGSTVEASALHADPHFAGTTNLHIDAGSPLIDAGASGSLGGGEPATDLDGNARILDGNGDCTANRDIGAYEYVAPLKVTASGTPASGTAGQALSFHAAGCGIDASLAAPTYTWSFDDGTTASGDTVAHAFLTTGTHTATVTAHDTAGHTGTSTTAVTVSPRSTTTTTTTSTHTLTVLSTTPALSHLRLSATRFRLHQPRHGRRVKLGTAVSWTDTLAATTTLTVTASARGIASGKRCVPIPRHLPKHPHRCTRTVTLGAVTHHDRAGANTFTFSGRLGRHLLATGHYRLTLLARLGRHTSRPAGTLFTVTS